MKIIIIVCVTSLILSLSTALLSKPHSKVQKISIEIIEVVLGCVIAILLSYLLATIIIEIIKS